MVSGEQLVKQIKSTLAQKNFRIALGQFDEYARVHGSVPGKEFTQLVDMLREENDPFATHSVVQLVPFVRRKQFNAVCSKLVCQYLDHNQPESSLSFLRAVQLANAGKVEIDYQAIEKLILTAKYLDDVDFAWGAMKTLLSLHSRLYSRTWGLFLSLVLEHGHYEALKWIYNQAGIPGYVVFDDHSYYEMARIASENGDVTMCSWAKLGLRMRHEFIFSAPSSKDFMLDIYLLEASASHGLSTEGRGSIRSACNIITEMGEKAGGLSLKHIPKFLNALKDPEVYDYVTHIYQRLRKYAGAHEMVKTVFFNILINDADVERSLDLYHEACDDLVQFNQDSILQLLATGEKMWDLGFCQLVMESGGPATRLPQVQRAYESVRRSLSVDR